MHLLQHCRILGKATLSEPELILSNDTIAHQPSAQKRDKRLSFICPVSQKKIIAWVRLDNRRELASKLNILAAQTSDLELLVAAYDRWQDDCVLYLVGDFSFALYDPSRNSVLLARDPIGVRPLYYQVNSNTLNVSTAASALITQNTERDLDWAARNLLNLSFSQTTTGYKDIFKLAPGHTCLVTATHVFSKRYFYWRDDAPIAKKRDPKWVDAYVEKLHEAVVCRLDEGNIACENSGGLDSATITGLTAKLYDKRKVHTMGFAVLEEEAAHILATSQMHKLQHNHLLTSYQKLSDELIDELLDNLGYPAEHDNGASHLQIYNICSSLGINSLLSGFGGDEAVTYTARQLRYELMDQCDWSNLHKLMPGNRFTSTLRLIKSVIKKNKRQTYDTNFRSTFTQRWPFHGVKEEFIRTLNLETAFIERAVHDAPYRRINDVVIHYNLAASYLPTRLENCSLIAAMYGVEYSWPLLDQRLIQQYLSTPAIEKYGPNGMGRYLHRRAMEGIAPAKVQWKRSKNMGIANFLENELKPENLLEVAQSLHDQLDCVTGALATIVDVAKLRQIASNLPKLPNSEMQAAMFMIKQSTTKLHWLNRWFARPY